MDQESKPASQAAKHVQLVPWIGLLLGPMLCGVCLWLLPTEYTSVSADAAAAETEFSWAGRATLAVMVWMGVWWWTGRTHQGLIRTPRR